MKQVYAVSDLDCIVCSNALETKLNTIPGVRSASINIFLQELMLDADDERFDEILRRVKRVVDHAIPGATLS